MQSIIDILCKNFKEDHTNSRRFPGFPGVVDTLPLTNAQTHNIHTHRHGFNVQFKHKSRYQLGLSGLCWLPADTDQQLHGVKLGRSEPSHN